MLTLPHQYLPRLREVVREGRGKSVPGRILTNPGTMSDIDVHGFRVGIRADHLPIEKQQRIGIYQAL